MHKATSIWLWYLHLPHLWYIGVVILMNTVQCIPRLTCMFSDQITPNCGIQLSSRLISVRDQSTNHIFLKMPCTCIYMYLMNSYSVRVLLSYAQAQSRRGKDDDVFVYPYDLGCWNNFTQVWALYCTLCYWHDSGNHLSKECLNNWIVQLLHSW